jgi:hypothetical protein
MSPSDSADASYSGLAALVIVLAVFGALTAAIARSMQPMTALVRIGAAVALLFPAGLLMWMAFPLALKLAAPRACTLLPWFRGLNGAASIMASVLGICLALTWSISAAFWTGCTACVVALAAFAGAACIPATNPRVGV